MIRPIVYVLVYLVLYGSAAMGAGDSILLGQSSPFSGHAQNLGGEVRAGLQAAFAEINDGGGVHGRNISLITRDDGYEPDKALRNSKCFIEEDEVFALVGQVGTPTAQAVFPLANEKGVPLFAPLTGAEFLRTPFQPSVINLRASYAQEMEALVRYLVEVKGLKRLACFYQNDSYGDDGLQGLKKSLERHSLPLVATGTYERNTIAILGAVNEIAAQNPDAIIMIGAYASCAEFIKLYRTKMGPDTLFASISFVGTESLRDALGTYGEGVVVSQVIPNLYEDEIPLIESYKKAMYTYRHNIPLSFNSFEGYISGRLFGLIARAVDGELTAESFIKTMEQLGEIDLGGLRLLYGPDDHQGLDEVFVVEIYPEIRRVSMMPNSLSQP